MRPAVVVLVDQTVGSAFGWVELREERVDEVDLGRLLK
jgi:hypothetical protein